MFWWKLWLILSCIKVIGWGRQTRWCCRTFNLRMILCYLVQKVGGMFVLSVLLCLFSKLCLGWEWTLIKACWLGLIYLILGSMRQRRGWVVKSVRFLLFTWACLLGVIRGVCVFGNLLWIELKIDFLVGIAGFFLVAVAWFF